VNFGRTAAVTYDPVRQEILVPNGVNHPQIAVFAKSAKEDTPSSRLLRDAAQRRIGQLPRGQ
jgi:hypothetical protein